MGMAVSSEKPMGTNTPTFPANSTVANNCSNFGSAFSYKASDSSFFLHFTMNASPFVTNLLIMDALIGPMPPSNQGIAVTVNQDFFGKDLNLCSPFAGPFANLVNGLNNLVLWPKPAGTTAIDSKDKGAMLKTPNLILQSVGKRSFRVNLKNWRLQVFELKGRSVYRAMRKNSGMIEMVGLKAGLYMARLDSDHTLNANGLPFKLNLQ